ncbi:MAG TPA: zinc-binding alcohol dehydrogenase [Steroidobacteraceae bacterium]|nr:zinc-binding alcohol dehydrogenase [Steroidobacteraceae bacterium]
MHFAKDNTLAFWIATPGHGELRRETVAPPGALEATVQTLYSGVSRGTESLVFAGRVPRGEYQRMRAPFQVGDFPGPVKYGYTSVGKVLHGPPGLAGQNVFCLYPHQQHYTVAAAALHVLPEGVPPARAVLAANLETALNGLWDAAVSPGDRVTVIGAGSVGCLTAWLAARIPGCEVELIDINAQRAAIARALKVNFALPDAARAEADVVLHASGSGEGLSQALRIAAFEATVVELSWYADRPVTLALGEAFHARRLTLKSSQVGSIGTAHRPRWDLQRRMQLALSLLSEPALDVLINSEGRFEDLPQSLERLARAPGDSIMHRVTYGSL